MSKDVEKMLMRTLKKTGEIPDKVIERMEDVYGVDLTHEFGEDSEASIKRIMRKIK